MVVPSDDLGETVHRGLDDVGDRVVIEVARLAGLEEDVGVLGGAAQDRLVGIEPPFPVSENTVDGDHVDDVLITELLDLVHFVRRAESVEEMEERDPRFERCRVRDQREIVRFLYGRARQHRPPGHPGRHHVAVIAEDRKGMGRHGARRHVEHSRQQLAGDLVHVRNHQQQALRCGEGGGESPALE